MWDACEEGVVSHHCPTGWHAVPQHWCREKHGCTCDGCVADYRRHWRAKMHRLYGYTDRGLEPGDMTAVKLRMLLDAGWSQTAIAAEVGCNRHVVGWIIRGEQRRVSARIRSRVDRLWRGALRGVTA